MTTLPLFDTEDLPAVGTPPPAPYVRHSVTSREAAEAIAPKVGTLQRRVLAWLVAAGPQTDQQMQAGLRMGETQRPRRIELVAMGFVRDSGQRAKTTSGRNAVLWEATDAGRRFILDPVP